MNDNLVTIKAFIAAAFTAIGAFLGWKGVMMVTWVVAMALDYITGTLAACRSGEWCSATARDGLWHKGGMIFVVMVAGIADLIMVVIGQHIPIGIQWPGIVLPLVISWYIITELGYKQIAGIVNLSRDSVRSYCKTRGLTGGPDQADEKE